MENDEKRPVPEMTTDELIFEHRIVAVEWARAHADAFVRDEFGEYLPFDHDKNERLKEVVRYANRIEDELEKRLNRG